MRTIWSKRMVERSNPNPCTSQNTATYGAAENFDRCLCDAQNSNVAMIPNEPCPFGGGNKPVPPDDGKFTTTALGEEGSDAGGPGQVTTLAVGEEGPDAGTPGPITTLAVGEEGEAGDPGKFTTMALGEEGSIDL